MPCCTHFNSTSYKLFTQRARQDEAGTREVRRGPGNGRTDRRLHVSRVLGENQRGSARSVRGGDARGAAEEEAAQTV